MRVCGHLLDAGVETHVLCGQAIEQLVQPLAQLVGRELFGSSITLRDQLFGCHGVLDGVVLGGYRAIGAVRCRDLRLQLLVVFKSSHRK